MSTPPNAVTTCSKAARTEAASVTSHSTGIASAADRLGFLDCGRKVDVEQRYRRARGREGLRDCRADGAAGAGDGRDLAGERFLGDCAELCLFERPVFHVEHVGFGNSLEASDRLGIGDGVDGGFGKIGGDARVLARSAEPEQSEAGHEHDPRQWIERALCAAGARIVAREIGVVVGDEFRRRLFGGAAEVRELSSLRRRQNERPVLGADGVVGRDHARLAVTA